MQGVVVWEFSAAAAEVEGSWFEPVADVVPKVVQLKGQVVEKADEVEGEVEKAAEVEKEADRPFVAVLQPLQPLPFLFAFA